MNSKLIKFTFKNMLLPTLILGGILVVAAFLIAITAGVQDEYIKVIEYGLLTRTYIYSSANSGLTVFVAFALSAAFLMGLTIFTYRHSIKKADLFYQIPYNEKSLRNSRILVGLLYTAIIYTLAFLVLIFIYGIRWMITPEVKDLAQEILIRASIYPKYYVIAFIVGLTSACATYLITCFFASTASSLENSIAISLEGLLLLGGTAFVLFYGLWEIEATKTNYAIEGGLLDNVAHNFGLSPYQVGMFINRVTNYHAVGDTEAYFQGELETLIADVVLYVLLGGVLLIPLLLSKEPSAETCGKGFGNNKFDRVIHHVTFGLICFLAYIASSPENLVIYLIFYLIIVSIYFLSTAGLNRTFKIKMCDILPMIINASGTLISSTIFMISYGQLSI